MNIERQVAEPRSAWDWIVQVVLVLDEIDSHQRLGAERGYPDGMG